MVPPRPAGPRHTEVGFIPKGRSRKKRGRAPARARKTHSRRESNEARSPGKRRLGKRPGSRRTPPRRIRREDSDAPEACVGWLRRHRTATWVDPEPHGSPLFIRDGSADDIEADGAVRFRISKARTAIRSAEATVVEFLGESDSDAVRLRMGAADIGLPDEFPEDALAQAEEFDVVDADAALADGERRDLRDQPHVTIDGEDARDFDDAVSARPEGESFRVWISIADVASYVQPRTALDREARHRGTSVYLPTQVLPMLPERLSNDLCSLRADEPRHTLTCEMVIDERGERGEVRVYPSLIRSAARLAYTQVQNFIYGDTGAVPRQAVSAVRHAIDASALLRKRRFRRGSLDLEIAEAEVVTDESGAPVDVVARTPLPAHGVIEDLMIAANESVAEYLLEHGLAGVYRVHPPPAREKWESLQRWGERYRLALRIGKGDNPKNMASFVRSLKELPQAAAGQMLLLRSLSQAYYAPQVAQHFGLASKAYAHFTSPIRRYPDLLVHRALWNHWKGRPKLRGLEAASEQCSQAERRAVDAERKITHLAACLVARQRVGKEMPARIVGVHAAGVFVRPNEFFAEGLIPMESLGARAGEYMEVWEDAHMVVGRRSGTRYALGDALVVRLTGVDMGLRRIQFEMIDPPGAGSGQRRRRR